MFKKLLTILLIVFLGWGVFGALKIQAFTLSKIGSFDFSDHGWDIAIKGDYAYIADTHDGLLVVDVSDLSSPKLVGQYSTMLGGPPEIDVDGNYAYIAQGNSMKIIDISNPSSPYLKSEYDFSGWSKHLVGKDRFVYMREKVGSFDIIDVSQPNNPIKKETISRSGSLFAEKDNYLAVADEGNEGVFLYRIENPGNIQLISSSPIEGMPEQVRYIDVNKNWLIATDSEKLYVTKPAKTEKVVVVDLGMENKIADDIKLVNNCAYILIKGKLISFGGSSKFTNSKMVVYDLSGFEEGKLTKIKEIEVGETAKGLGAKGNHLFVLHSKEGVFVYETISVSGATLLKTRNDPRVYEIKDNKKHWIPSAEVFNSSGFKWTDVQEVEEDELVQYSRTKLIQAQGDFKVYYLTERGLIRHIPTPEVFTSYGNKWEDIFTINQTELNIYPENNLIHLEGDHKIYKQEFGIKSWIKTAEAFNRLGFDWNKIAPVNIAEFNHYPTGSVIE